MRKTERFKQSIIARNKLFFKVWLAQFISLFGDVFYDVAIVWFLIETTGSALIAGGIAIFSLIGTVVGSIVLGQKIDMWNTRDIMLRVNVLRAIILIGVVIAISTITFPLIAFYTLSLFMAFLNVCYRIARRKSVAEVVAREDLLNANGFDGISGSIVQIFSWALGGFIVLLFGVIFALGVNALTAGIAFFLTLSAKWRSVKDENNASSKLQVVEGLKRIREKRSLSVLVSLETFHLFMMGFFWAALPLKIAEIGNAFFYGLQGAAFGVGFFITSTYLGHRKHFARIGLIYLVGLFVHWIGNFGAAWSTHIWLFILGVFVSGLGNSFWQTCRQTIFHASIPTSEVGRVFAVFESLTSIVLIPAWIFGGYLADRFSPTFVMVMAGIFQFIIIALAAVQKSLRRQTISGV